jgi:hypothetical protein
MKLELNSRHFCKGNVIINREVFHATGEGLRNLLVRRINATVDRNGFFDAACEPAVWQECIHTGEFHNMNGFFSMCLERAYTRDRAWMMEPPARLVFVNQPA